MRFRIMAILACLSASAGLAGAQTNYRPSGYVNDFASKLTPDAKQNLEQTLRGYQQQTSIELVVVTVPSLDGMSVEEYANRLFKDWGIGQKGKSNGVLFLIAPTEHRMRIETGYGMEPDLTDLQCGRILDLTVKPLFKQDNFPDGISAGVADILKELGTKPFQERLQERAAAAERQRRESERENQQIKSYWAASAVVLIVSVVLIALVVSIRNFFRRRRERRRLMEENVRLTAEMMTQIRKAELANRQAMLTVQALKDEHPNAWKDLAPKGSPDDLREKVKSSATSESHSLSTVRHINATLHTLRLTVDEYAKFPETVARRITVIKTAKKAAADMLRDDPEQIRLLSEAARHADVTSETRRTVTGLQSSFVEAQTLQTSPGPCDYQELFRRLTEVGSLIAQTKARIDAEKAYAVRARAEGPGLLKSIPDLISSAESAVSQSDVSGTTRGKVTSAKREFADARAALTGRTVDWVAGFTLLNQIKDALDRAISSAHSDRNNAEEERDRARRRREEESYAAISSSSSSSSSSSDFGGFGGGSSGGGGASSSW